jgi:hypothetical protein
MELEALKEIDSEIQRLEARIVVLTPELERYTRALHKKLSLPFDILTGLHLKTAEQILYRRCEARRLGQALYGSLSLARLTSCL